MCLAGVVPKEAIRRNAGNIGIWGHDPSLTRTALDEEVVDTETSRETLDAKPDIVGLETEDFGPSRPGVHPGGWNEEDLGIGDLVPSLVVRLTVSAAPTILTHIDETWATFVSLIPPGIVLEVAIVCVAKEKRPAAVECAGVTPPKSGAMCSVPIDYLGKPIRWTIIQILVGPGRTVKDRHRKAGPTSACGVADDVVVEIAQVKAAGGNIGRKSKCIALRELWNCLATISNGDVASNGVDVGCKIVRHLVVFFDAILKVKTVSLNVVADVLAHGSRVGTMNANASVEGPMDTAILEVAVTASIAEYMEMHWVSKSQRGGSKGAG